MTRTQERSIKDADDQDHKYEVTQWTAEKQWDKLAKIAKMFLPSMGAIGDAFNEKKEAGSSGKFYFAKAAELLTDRLDRPESWAMIQSLFSSTTRDGEKVQVNNTYSNNFQEMFQAIGFIMETNYSSFFAGGSGGLSGIFEKLEKMGMLAKLGMKVNKDGTIEADKKEDSSDSPTK